MERKRERKIISVFSMCVCVHNWICAGVHVCGCDSFNGCQMLGELSLLGLWCNVSTCLIAKCLWPFLGGWGA